MHQWTNNYCPYVHGFPKFASVGILRKIHLSFAYACIAVGDPVIKGEGCDLINLFHPRNMSVPVRSQYLDFQRHMS